MAASYKCSIQVLLVMVTLIVALSTKVQSMEFKVGGKNGWVTPKSDNDQGFDDWASKNRFKVNDTLRFVYKKDSVLAVTQEDHKKCRSTYPIFFSNDGNSTFTLDRPGMFYFISGIAGHCDKGLKMVVKVLEPEQYLVPPPASNETVAAPPEKSSGVSVHVGLPSVPLAFAFYSFLF